MITIPFVRIIEVMSLSDINDRITEDFYRFSHILQTNVAIIRKIKPRLIPSTYFTICYSVSVIKFSVMSVEVFTVSLLKS
jgi:hypothetical protein